MKNIYLIDPKFLLTITLGMILGFSIVRAQEITGERSTDQAADLSALQAGGEDGQSALITGGGDINFGNNVSIYPNPTRGGRIHIKFDHNKRQNYNINIYGSGGDKIRESLLGDFEKGEIEVDGSGLAPGFYYIHIRGEYGSVMEKILILP